jgi:hypothetical protein
VCVYIYIYNYGTIQSAKVGTGTKKDK